MQETESKINVAVVDIGEEKKMRNSLKNQENKTKKIQTKRRGKSKKNKPWQVKIRILGSKNRELHRGSTENGGLSF